MSTIEELADSSVAPLDDEELVRLAEQRGYVIHRPEPPIIRNERFDTSRLRGDRIRIAIVSDTHLGSRYQQITFLREFVAYARKRKVKAILHCGDVTDGPFRRHRNPHEVWLHTWQAMVDYAVEALPECGIPWYVISGNHDDWFLDDGGADVVAAICDRRDDFTYLGRAQAFMSFGDVRVELAHPNMGTAYALCVDAETEILTEDGWRLFKDLTGAERVATLSPEGRVEWHRPLAVFRYWYEGQLVCTASRLVDLRVTPEHDLYAGFAWEYRGRYGRPRTWSRRPAIDVMRAAQSGNVRMKRDALPQVGPTPEWFDVPSLTKRHNKPVLHLGRVPMRPLLRFLGYYTAEGVVVRGRSGHPAGGVVLAQKTHPDVSLRMAEAIRALGVKPTITKGGVCAASRELAAVASECGLGAANKRVPRWILGLDASLIREFFDAYMEGDGSANGAAAYTVSRQLADDLQEIALRLGIAASVHLNGQGHYSVSFSRRKNEPKLTKGLHLEEYVGWVYDVAVPPNHVIYVRRRGKACWTGNSYNLQKHIEGMPPEEKPHIYLAGNMHKAAHLPGYRNVEGFLLPAYQSRTHWMRGKRLASVVGGIILEFGIVAEGVAPALQVEWVLERIPREQDWPVGR